MQLINPLLTNNNLTNDGINDLLEGIDNTIALMAGEQYRNHAYGFTAYVDFSLYDRLCEYREILMDKFMGCNCLDDEYTLFIISKVQKMIC